MKQFLVTALLLAIPRSATASATVIRPMQNGRMLVIFSPDAADPPGGIDFAVAISNGTTASGTPSVGVTALPDGGFDGSQSARTCFNVPPPDSGATSSAQIHHCVYDTTVGACLGGLPFMPCSALGADCSTPSATRPVAPRVVW